MNLHTERDKSRAKSLEICAVPAVAASQSDSLERLPAPSYSSNLAKTAQISAIFSVDRRSANILVFDFLQVVLQGTVDVRSVVQKHHSTDLERS